MKPQSIPFCRVLPRFSLWRALFFSIFATCSFAFGDTPPLPGAKVIALDRQASETGPDEGTFLVLRTGSTETSLTVFYSVGGTAEPGIDYQELPGYVTIPAGFASAFVFVNPIDDLEMEERETVVLTVIDSPEGDTYVPCWPARARVAIEDDDTVQNSLPRVGIVNPDDGAVFVGPESIVLIAKASDEDGFVKTVEFFDGDTSLGVVEYPRPITRDEAIDNPELLENAISRRLFELDQNQVDPLPGVEDIFIPEPIEDQLIQIFRLRWKNIEPGEHVITALATDTDGESTLSEPIVITVKKGPAVSVVNVVAIDPIASERGANIIAGIESDADTPENVDPVRPDVLKHNNAVFVIKRRAADISRPLHVFYRVDGTATNGEDYRRIPHHVTIPANAYAVRVTVRPIDDELVEGRETVVIKLAPHVSTDILRDIPGTYRVGKHDIARAVILDDDQTSENLPPAVRMVRPHNGAIFREGADITLIADAADRDGYVKSVEFFEGENSLGVVENPLVENLDVSGDPLQDADKAILRRLPLYRISWSDVPAGSYVLTAVATDNEGEQAVSRPIEIRVVENGPVPVVNIIARDPVAQESSEATDVAENTATFVVLRRGGEMDKPLTVYYRIGGKAENGIDYRKLESSVEIAAGEYKALITIAPIDDDLCEGRESVIIGLVSPEQRDVADPVDVIQPYRVGRPGKAWAVIRDNDDCPENIPPEVTLVLPVDGMVFQAPVSIPIFALAGDPDGEVEEVSPYANDQFIGTAARIGPYFEWALYAAEWADAPAGEFDLTAVVIDDEGDWTQSAPVSIEVLPEEESTVDVIGIDEETIETDSGPVSVWDDTVAVTFVGSSVVVSESGEVVERHELEKRGGVLANISTRGQVKTGSGKMIVGFVVTGTGNKEVMIRAVGPTLDSFGVSGSLEDPLLELFSGGATSPDFINDDWGSSDPVGIRGVATRLGAFGLADGSRDSALVVSLPPGSYTAQVGGDAAGTGVGLVEVYDADVSASGESAADIVNISTRGEVGTDDDVMIAGFIVSGPTPRQVLVRGIGPTLAGYGVLDTLADPKLELFVQSNGAAASPLSTNDNWEDYDGQSVADAGTAVGSFPLESGSKDAAILIWLEPGTYTAQLSGQNGGTGIGLIEVFEVE